MKPLILLLPLVHLLMQITHAHEEPTSYLDIEVQTSKLAITLTASATDLAHDMPDVEPDMLLEPSMLAKKQHSMSDNVLSRLKIASRGVPLVGKLESAEVVEKDVRLLFSFPHETKVNQVLEIQCALFPYDSRHQTFLTLHRDGQLLRQEIFTGPPVVRSVSVDQTRSVWEVAWEFVKQGVHHIFIGTDHIVFIVGLLLLGGSLRRLLLITTAFTLAHSITLVLATLRIVNPSSAIIEPVIALSIVIVGAHAFLRRGGADHRLWLAFILGLLHGFGFASVLQELHLPSGAFVTSLASFNIGVELGQAAIVLICVPLLMVLQKRYPRYYQPLLTTAALLVVTVGSYWFFQRVLE